MRQHLISLSKDRNPDPDRIHIRTLKVIADQFIIAIPRSIISATLEQEEEPWAQPDPYTWLQERSLQTFQKKTGHALVVRDSKKATFQGEFETLNLIDSVSIFQSIPMKRKGV